MVSGLSVSVNGSITFTTIGGKTGAYFNNSGTFPNYLTFPFTYSSSFTFSYWIYGGTAGSGDHTACTIINSGLSTNQVLSDYYPGNFSYAQLYVALPTQWTSTANNATITAGQWNHIAYSINGTSIQLYINGSLSKTATGSAVMLNNESSVVLLGRGPTRGFNGYIRQFQFYNYILSDAQINSVYTSTA